MAAIKLALDERRFERAAAPRRLDDHVPLIVERASSSDEDFDSDQDAFLVEIEVDVRTLVLADEIVES